MKKSISLISFLVLTILSYGQQKDYQATLKSFISDYVKSHEVVKDADKNYFRFFPVDEEYCLTAAFEKINDTAGFIMKTSGKKTSRYFKYGLLHFKIRDTMLQLTVYSSEDLQHSEKYKDYLFVPYTDLTSGEESYGGGKYLEFYKQDIVNNSVNLDFNKAYNPYCAYALGYNCPIPPRENDLPVAIRAGEMMFAKDH